MAPAEAGELTLDVVLGDLQTLANAVIDEQDGGTASYETVQQRLGELSMHPLTYIRFLENYGYARYDRSADQITMTDAGREAAGDASMWSDQAESEFLINNDVDATRATDLREPIGEMADDVDEILDSIGDDDIEFALEEATSGDADPDPKGGVSFGSRLRSGSEAEPAAPIVEPEESPAERTQPDPEPSVARGGAQPPRPQRPEQEIGSTSIPKPGKPAPADDGGSAPPDASSTTSQRSENEGKSMSNDSYSSRRPSSQSSSPSRGGNARASASSLYDRQEAVGSGGIGTVYLAEQVKLKRPVAIKEIKEIFDVFAGVQRADIVGRFSEIIQTQAQLIHPNIINIVDIDTDAQFPFVVMEFAPNGNLRRLIDADDRPPLQTALKYFLQILHALNTAHDNGVTHGGIKPENVVLDHAGNAMLTDFGISGVAELDANRGANQVYVGVGTVAYMSPEQFKDPNTSSVKTDIYSLGIMFYEMLTGKVPGRRSPMPSSFFPDIPRALDDVFDRMSMDDVEERYASISEIIEDIYRAEDVMEILDKKGGILFLRDPNTHGASGGVGADESSEAALGAESSVSEVSEISEATEASEVSEADVEESEPEEDVDDEDADLEEGDDEAEGEDGDVLDKLDKYGELFDEDEENSEADDEDADDEEADEDDEDDD